MKRKNWRSALKVDFSEDSALKEMLLQSLLQRPDAPIDMKEDASMKKTIKYSTRALICALITVILISGVALAAMKTFSLGPFVSYVQRDDEALRKEIDEYVNGNRSVWEGKLFDKDGKLIEDLAEYMWESVIGENTYELYDADGELCGLTNIDGEVVLAGPNDRPSKSDITWMFFDSLAEVKPYLNPALEPKLPTVLPNGYKLDYFSIFTDDEGKPYPETEYLTISYTKQDKALELDLRLMNENTAFEAGSTASLTEMTINGHAAIAEGDMLHLLLGDVLYSFNPRNSFVTMDELIKMAESIPE